MRIFITIFSLFLFLTFFSTDSFAKEQESLPVITVVNPIRGNELGLEKTDLFSSLKAQWKVTKDQKINATWLWQYSALENKSLIQFAISEMKNQEFGLFFEVDRNTAAKAGVQYRGQGPWYFSDGVFLMAYDIAERKKLIDAAFVLFKKQFGYYPKTVGAWWIGGDSISYMQQKYGIVTALKAADQYDLDVYSLLGTPWSIPYIASKNNEGIPAGINDSSQVVILQWAARDPTDGYKDATYSVQDFGLKQYDFSYFDYLISVFLKKPLDHIVVGLENGGNVASFESSYSIYLKKAKGLENQGKVDILLAKDYAEKFLAKKKTFSDNRYFLTKAYKSEDMSFWYNSEYFRAGIHKIGDAVYLIDVRDYSKKGNEDFSYVPNSQGYLRIATPTLIDSMRMPSQRLLIATTTGALTIDEHGGTVTLLSGNKKVATFTNTSFELFSDKTTTKKFNFVNQSTSINIFALLLGIFFVYFFIMCLTNKNLKASLGQICLLAIPLIIAYPFLSSGPIDSLQFVFDRKEIVLFSVLPVIKTFPITYTLFVFQIVPFIFLLLVHYVYVILLRKKIYKIIYYLFFSTVVFLYAHCFYFPIDRSTYGMVLVITVLLCCLFFGASIIVFKKTAAKKMVFVSLIVSSVILILLAGVIYFSRTKVVLTPFEMDALKVMKEKQKDILFVSETKYNIRPIYKAVEPLLYENYQIGAKLTGTNWEIVNNLESKVVERAVSQDKLIVVPRYLGGDFSEAEVTILKLKKIFDNAQIAIFEKE